MRSDEQSGQDQAQGCHEFYQNMKGWSGGILEGITDRVSYNGSKMCFRSLPSIDA